MHRAYPIPIVTSNGQHKFELNVKALEDALLRDDIKDCNAVVVSVAGSFRKGKSFLLDFFLRYMNHVCKSSQPINGSWLGDVNRPLEGFSWRGGSERTTTGILMWSEIFCLTLPNNERVAVIFLDTQGTFDGKSTIQDCATVFALSTMLSSIQVYNLFHNIQEDDLQHLELFSKYGCLAMEETGHKPFQKLQFLIRDWSYPYEANYGSEGGRKILDKMLEITDVMHSELQSLRKHIRSCFDDIQCFLMPHPGFKVTTNPNFDGRLSDMEDSFKTCLEQFVPMLLSKENIVQKEIGGEKVKVKDLVRYFKCYMEVFSGDGIPQPKSILAATAIAGNQSAAAAAKEAYHQLIMTACEAADPYLSCEEIDAEHRKCKAKAVEKFASQRKIGGDEFAEQYRIRLEQEMDRDYSTYKSLNRNKMEVKIQSAFTEAKDTYCRLMMQIFEGPKSCINSEELLTEHARCKNEVLEMFGKNCKPDESDIFMSYRIKLEEDIDNGYEQFKASNQNIVTIGNQLAFANAKESYRRQMLTNMSINENTNKPYLTSVELETKHIECKDQVVKKFCEEYGKENTEVYRSLLEQDIDIDYSHFKISNKDKAESCNQSALTKAKETYHRLMTTVLQECTNGSKPYVEWNRLEQEHLKIKKYASEQFRREINMEGDELYESYKDKLIQSIDDEYTQVKNSNHNSFQSYAAEKLLRKKKEKEQGEVCACVCGCIICLIFLLVKAAAH
ncbi:atlastin-like [Planococcus citri]|uniref:atlastin-like n=1 Tax=Planococcus citri TaxID=170843 RepID=UPI0031F72F59